MTDRGESAFGLSDDQLQIGPSAMVWKGDSLEVHINEVSTPHAQRVKGTVTIHPSALTDQEMLLTDDGAHVWRPFAPTARIEQALLDMVRPQPFRRKFRDPRAGDRFQLLDVGAVSVEGWLRVFLRP